MPNQNNHLNESVKRLTKIQSVELACVRNWQEVWAYVRAQNMIFTAVPCHLSNMRYANWPNNEYVMKERPNKNGD